MIKKITLSLLLCTAAQPLFAATVDTLIGNTAPKEFTKNHKVLAHHLCDGLPNDQEKANAIYNWITHNIAYDAKALQKGAMKHEKATVVFRKRKGVCEGYSRLFAAMCAEVGVTALSIDGYAKDWAFDNGDKLYIPRHTWNAFFADGNWYLADVTWGAGGLVQKPGWLRSQLNKISRKQVHYSKKLRFDYNYDPQYFMQDAAAFRVKHLPLDPLWQLSDTAMPIQVFENGEKAINVFNEHTHNELRNSYLNQLGMLNEMQRTYESADRVHAYNERFPLIMASKHELVALDNMNVAMVDSNRDYSTSLFTDAKTQLKQADKFVSAQKKNISEEYAALKKKNKVKFAEANKSIRTIRTDNKRLTAQCNMRARASENKLRMISAKINTEQHKNSSIDAGSINRIKTALNERDADSPEMLTLLDSVDQREARLADIKASLKGKEKQQEAMIAANRQKLDDLKGYVQVADSAMISEAIERIHMRDNYDDEVIAWNDLLKTQKFELADGAQKQYFDNYDTVIAGFEAQKKAYVLAQDLYRKNLHDLEQYKRLNSHNTSLAEEYATTANAYHESHNNYMSLLQQYGGYVSGNKGLFGNLVKVYRNETRVTDYMEKAEAHRKDLEEKYIAKKQAFDEKENRLQKQSIKSTTTKGDRLYAKLTTGKKKRSVRKA